MPDQALSDVKVLDLTWYVAGPYCTKLLADYGADVLKVERPGSGDPARRLGPFPKDEPHPEKSAFFSLLNTNKRGITLDLKSITGKKMFKDLVRGVDILVENFSPRVMPSLGLDYKALAQENPRLVMTSIANFGQFGPYRDFKASDIILHGMGGDMYICGLPEREPVTYYGAWIQFQAGVAAAVATMGASCGAQGKGIGQQVDVSIMETQSTSTDRRMIDLLAYQYCGECQPRIAEAGGTYPGGPYPCKDGYFRLQGGGLMWDRTGKMLGNPEFLKDPKWSDPVGRAAPALKEEFEAFFLAWLMERTKDECLQAGQAARVLCAALYTVDELLTTPHFQGRETFVELDRPLLGRATYPGRPFIMNETPWRVNRPAPLLGQHNKEVYEGLGFSSQDLVKLRETGVI